MAKQTLSARERIFLAIDTSNETEAERLARLAKKSGARFIKLGLELSSATSWQYCSELAADNELDWVADAKLDDIPNTVVGAVKNLKGLEYPPFAITMHTTAGKDAMRAAQEEAGDIKMLGVTILTSIEEEEAAQLFGPHVTVEDIINLYNQLKDVDLEIEEDVQENQLFIDEYFQKKADEMARQKVLELARNAASVGLKGVVCSPLEVGMIKSNPETQELFAMIPGTRSASADVQDQARTGTPVRAIEDGADALVIGRQVTQAEDPAQAYEALVSEIEAAM